LQPWASAQQQPPQLLPGRGEGPIQGSPVLAAGLSQLGAAATTAAAEAGDGADDPARQVRNDVEEMAVSLIAMSEKELLRNHLCSLFCKFILI
jgi:hypothetical protein